MIELPLDFFEPFLLKRLRISSESTIGGGGGRLSTIGGGGGGVSTIGGGGGGAGHSWSSCSSSSSSLLVRVE